MKKIIKQKEKFNSEKYQTFHHIKQALKDNCRIWSNKGIKEKDIAFFL